MDKQYLENLYKGQQFEYQTISDLYRLGYDAFKAPVDYGIDVIGVQNPLFKNKLQGTTIANILLIQTKSVTITENQKYYRLKDKEQMPSSDFMVIHNIELNPFIGRMSEFDNVLVYFVIYVTIPKSMVKFLFGKDQNEDVTSTTLQFFLPLEDLIKLKDNHYLNVTYTDEKSQSEKCDLTFRLQGVSKSEKHSLEFWIQCCNPKDSNYAWSVVSKDLSELFSLKETNLSYAPVTFVPNKFTDASKKE